MRVSAIAPSAALFFPGEYWVTDRKIRRTVREKFPPGFLQLKGNPRCERLSHFLGVAGNSSVLEVGPVRETLGPI